MPFCYPIAWSWLVAVYLEIRILDLILGKVDEFWEQRSSRGFVVFSSSEGFGSETDRSGKAARRFMDTEVSASVMNERSSGSNPWWLNRFSVMIYDYEPDKFFKLGIF